MNRADIRRGARERRRKRKDLVHAAGCATQGCIVREVVFNDISIVNEAMACRVRIPRSIQKRWSR